MKKLLTIALVALTVGAFAKGHENNQQWNWLTGNTAIINQTGGVEHGNTLVGNGQPGGPVYVTEATIDQGGWSNYAEVTQTGTWQNRQEATVTQDGIGNMVELTMSAPLTYGLLSGGNNYIHYDKNVAVIDQDGFFNKVLKTSVTGEDNKLTIHQNGFKNKVDGLAIAGEDNDITIRQMNWNPWGEGNDVNISPITGEDNEVLVCQDGTGNDATVSINGDDNYAHICQKGVKNDATINQVGNHNSATIMQSNCMQIQHGCDPCGPQ